MSFRFMGLVMLPFMAMRACAAETPAAPGEFRFSLVRPAVTSAGVYTPGGQLVRVLWTMQPLPAGEFTRSWDGKDDFGAEAARGPYQVRIVANRAVYRNVGAIGNSGQPPDASGHIPTNLFSVAIDRDGSVYTANGWDESGADFKKWDASGATVYDDRGQIRNGDPNGAPYAITVDDEYVYCCVGAWDSTPWNEAQQVQRFRRGNAKEEPFPLSGRRDGHIQVCEWPSRSIPATLPAADRRLMKFPLQSLAVGKEYLFVADALTGRIHRFDKHSGQARGGFAVKLPQALAVDEGGRVWVGYDHHHIELFTADGVKVADGPCGVEEVRALAVGAAGRLLIADSAAGQVQIFDVSDVPRRVATIGAKAQPGDRDPGRFFELRGVAAGPSGEVVTIQTEPAGGARIAKWMPDGKLAWEHFGCETVSLGNFGAEQPDRFYSMTFHQYRLLDKNTGAWEYASNTCPWPQKQYTSDVHGVPRVVRLGSSDFYFHPSGDGMQVYRIGQNVFRLAALVGGRTPGPDGENGASALGQWTWHDTGSSGQPRRQDVEWFRGPGLGHYSVMGMDADNAGNIWYADTQTHDIHEIPIGPPDARGNPTYAWMNARAVTTPDTSTLKFEPVMVQAAEDGSFYALGWSAAWPPPKDNGFWMGASTLARFDPHGTRLWAVKLPAISVGLDVIPGGGCMAGQGSDAHINHYSADGLLIGRLEPGEAMRKESGAMDNHGSLAVNRDPRDKMIDVFAEDDFVQRIGWYRVDDRNNETLTCSLIR